MLNSLKKWAYVNPINALIFFKWKCINVFLFRVPKHGLISRGPGEMMQEAGAWVSREPSFSHAASSWSSFLLLLRKDSWSEALMTFCTSHSGTWTPRRKAAPMETSKPITVRTGSRNGKGSIPFSPLSAPMASNSMQELRYLWFSPMINVWYRIY